MVPTPRVSKTSRRQTLLESPALFPLFSNQSPDNKLDQDCKIHRPAIHLPHPSACFPWPRHYRICFESSLFSLLMGRRSNFTKKIPSSSCILQPATCTAPPFPPPDLSFHPSSLKHKTHSLPILVVAQHIPYLPRHIFVRFQNQFVIAGNALASHLPRTCLALQCTVPCYTFPPFRGPEPRRNLAGPS